MSSAKKPLTIIWPFDVDPNPQEWSGTPRALLDALSVRYDILVIQTVCHNRVLACVKRWLSRIKATRLVDYLDSLAIWLKLVFHKKKGRNILTFSPIPTQPLYRYFFFCDISYPHVYDVQKNDPELGQFSDFSSDMRYLKRVSDRNKKFFRKCTRLFTMGSYESIYLNGLMGVEKAIPFGGGAINHASIEECLDKKDEQFVFVGNRFIRKSGDLVVEAFRRVALEIPGVKLFVIGKEFFGEETPNITYMGECDKGTIQKMLAESKGFLLPSRFEAFGLALLEAVQSGCLCIGSTGFAMKELLGEDGYYVDPFAPDAVEVLCDYIKAIIERKQTSEEIRERIVKSTQMFSWERSAEIMSEAIDSCGRTKKVGPKAKGGRA